MHHPMISVTADLPFERIQFDCISSLGESTDGYKYVLVCVCVFSGCIVLKPMKHKDAQTTASVLFEIFSDYGFPMFLQSDNGDEL